MFGRSTFFLTLNHFLHFTLAVSNLANGVLSQDSTTATDALVRRYPVKIACTLGKDPQSKKEDVEAVLTKLENIGDATCFVSAELPSQADGSRCKVVETVGTAMVFACLLGGFHATYNCWEVANMGRDIQRKRCPEGGSLSVPTTGIYVSIYNPDK